MVSYDITSDWQEIVPPDSAGVLSNENNFRINIAVLPATPTGENFFTYNAYLKVAFDIPIGSKLYIKIDNPTFKIGRIRIDENNLLAEPMTSKVVGSDGGLITGAGGALRVISGYGDISKDAWGHQKMIHDVSLFSSSFTFNADRSVFVPFEDGAEVYTDGALTRYTFPNGKLNITSGAIIGQYAVLQSRRHARYQPNRGHLYSSSIFLPSVASIGERRFGLFNIYNGAFFSLEDGVMYAVVRTTINTVTSEPFKQVIDLTELNARLLDAGLSAIDYALGNIYDIQMQWRGVGNIKWFIGDPTSSYSVMVAEYEHLNTSTELSISNPSLPVGYECVNTNGTEVIMEGGCVDVTTEGGNKGKRTYGSFPSGEIAISIAETPILALRIPTSIGGTSNTRDIALTQVDGYADVNSLIRVYYFRDPSLITATWTPIRSGFQEQSIGTAITAFTKASMVNIFETRIPALDSKQFANPDKGNSDYFLTNGDYVLVTLTGKNNSVGGVTLEWGEEI